MRTNRSFYTFFYTYVPLMMALLFHVSSESMIYMNPIANAACILYGAAMCASVTLVSTIAGLSLGGMALGLAGRLIHQEKSGGYVGMLLGGTIGSMLPFVPDMFCLPHASAWAGIIGCVTYLQLRHTLRASPELLESDDSPQLLAE